MTRAGCDDQGIVDQRSAIKHNTPIIDVNACRFGEEDAGVLFAA
jgi:hypothetical protein